MYSLTDLKKETLIELNNIPYRVVDYQHMALGRGGAVAKVKIKNLLDGSVLSKTFRGSDKIEPAEILRVEMQYLYSDDASAMFMDTATYDQVALNITTVREALSYIKEGQEVQLFFFKGRPIGIDLPKNVVLKVTHTEPAVKGDTTSTVYKAAEVETGINVQVPLFIKNGDLIKIDTKTGQYLERV